MFTRRSHTFLLVILLVLGLMAAAKPLAAATDPQAARAEIDAFNRDFTTAHLRMDNAAILDMWATDGVSLLPGMAPLVGKPAITAFLDRVTSQMPGFRVTRQEDAFHDIQVSGEWASEWATTFQVVRPPDGKPAIETHGKMLLVLHRSADGRWRIQCEMWNGAPK